MKKALLSIFLLSACSNMPDGEDDPHSEFNRDMFNFNLALDENIVSPVASVYKETSSSTFRESVDSFLCNIKEPYYTINYFFSCEPEKAINSLFRFFINTVFGALGFADIGSYIGLERAQTSYKETLTKMEIKNGNYIVLPIFGPSSTRDTIGEIASWFCDPVGYIIGFPWMLGKAAVSVINERAENADTMNKAINGSMDLYSVMKSMYFQKYGVEIKKGKGREMIDDDSPTPDEEDI